MTPHARPEGNFPPPDQARVVGAYAQTAVNTALSLGVTERQLGYPEGLPANLSVSAYLTLIETAAQLCHDPCFGLHVGERMRPSTFATYSHVVLACPTFGEAVLQTRRFEGLAHDLGRTELLVEGDVAIYRWLCPWLAKHPSRHLPESVMAGIFCFANWLACRTVPLHELSFPHACDPAADPGEYTRIFGTPVRFNQPVTEARFPVAVLETPIPNADARLLPLIERHAVQQLQVRINETQLPGILREVRRCLMAQLAHDRVRIAEVAQSLGLPVRTLQRRLAEAGTGYAQELDTVRRELSEHYLRDPMLTLTEIAFLLGFHEQSSFNHAFRSWYGCTPLQWRTSHA